MDVVVSYLLQEHPRPEYLALLSNRTNVKKRRNIITNVSLKVFWVLESCVNGRIFSTGFSFKSERRTICTVLEEEVSSSSYVSVNCTLTSKAHFVFLNVFYTLLKHPCLLFHKIFFFF